MSITRGGSPACLSRKTTVPFGFPTTRFKASAAWKEKDGNTHTYTKLFDELLQSGVLVENGQGREFRENYAFKSPSAAAAVVNGHPANGTVEWKLVAWSIPRRQVIDKCVTDRSPDAWCATSSNTG